MAKALLRQGINTSEETEIARRKKRLWRREKWLGLTARSLFNSDDNEGHTTVCWFALKIMDQLSDLTQQ
jgi:hypothetical protein